MEGLLIVLGHSLEREGVILPGRLAVPHQVGARWVESQGGLSLEPADVAVVPPGHWDTGLLSDY